MSIARAAVCRQHGAPLVIEDVYVAEPGPEQVRVEIDVCAVCHSDISYAEGAWGGPTPAIYGHEAAGVVESVGRGVTALRPGDRVIVGLLRCCGDCFHCRRGEDSLCVGEFDTQSPFTDADGNSIAPGLDTGAFAGHTVVHESQVVPIPDDMPSAPAALLACGVLTGFGAVTNTARMPAGASAAVIGIGGVGLGTVQGAVHAGASRVIGIDLIDDKLSLAESFGLTDTINAAHSDAVAAARDITAGVGPDYVFVAVGAPQVVTQALNMVRRGGTVVLVGMPASGVMTSFETAAFADAGLRIIGSKMGSGRLTVDIPELIDLYRAGSLKLDEMISATYPLDRINEAIARVNAGRVVRILIEMGGR